MKANHACASIVAAAWLALPCIAHAQSMELNLDQLEAAWGGVGNFIAFAAATLLGGILWPTLLGYVQGGPDRAVDTAARVLLAYVHMLSIFTVLQGIRMYWHALRSVSLFNRPEESNDGH